ncbi:MAK10-like protein [Tanacetum coccineum]
MAKIAVKEGITRSVFGVKGVDLGEEEAPYWTTLGKMKSYKPRPRSDGIGARTPYYARKDFLDCHLPGKWEIARDAKLNPFKDTLVFRRMDKPSKNEDGAWHAKIRLIGPDEEEFTKTLQSIPTTRKLSEREIPIEIIDLDHFYDVKTSEYRGVTNVVAKTTWLHNLLRELHTPLLSATLVYYDNVSAIYMFANHVQHQRTKHIEIDIHFVRNMVARGQVRVLHVPSHYKYAEILTKGLPSVLFEEFRTSLSVRPSPA